MVAQPAAEGPDPALGEPAPGPPVPERHHRHVTGGIFRAAVFGASDGLVSNVALILAMAAASPGAGVVRLAGLAGMIAGAFSMAAGEYGSMTAQRDLLEYELDMERVELERNPHVETVELTQLYQARGIHPDLSRRLAEDVMSDPDAALEAHAREELGIDPESLGLPRGAALASFFSFVAGASLPLAPWFFTEGGAAVAASIVLGVLGASTVGVLLAHSTNGSYRRLVARYVLIAALSGSVTYLIGSAVGVGGTS